MVTPVLGGTLTMKNKKKAKVAKKAKKPVKRTQVRSKAARVHIAEGTRLFALAGRPTKAQFVKVYGPKGPAMTWTQRAKAGVDAKHFQAALAEKGREDRPCQYPDERSETDCKAKHFQEALKAKS
jgi:hypothetical protein